MKSAYKKGLYFALLAALISGVANFTNKFAVGVITPPLFFTAIKNVGAGILIVSFILLAGKWQKLRALTKTEIYQLLAIALVGGTIPFYLYFTGLSQVPAINAALIHKTLVIWVAFLAVPLLKERLTKTMLLAVVLLFGGNLLVGGFKMFRLSNGELMILAATILWAAETILAKKTLRNVDPDIVTGVRLGLGSLILVGASLFLYPRALGKTFTLSSGQWLLLLLAIGTLTLYVAFWYRALKYAPATTVAAVLVTATLVTNLLSAIFVTHLWTMDMVLQALAMVLGLAVITRQARSFAKPLWSKKQAAPLPAP